MAEEEPICAKFCLLITFILVTNKV